MNYCFSFWYPPRSAAALLEGILLLRYCAGRFASRIPTWRLPVDGHVDGLVAEDGKEIHALRVEHSADAGLPGFNGGGSVDWVSGPGGDVKRVQLNRKTPAHLVRHGILGSVSATCLEETEISGPSWFSSGRCQVKEVHQGGGAPTCSC